MIFIINLSGSTFNRVFNSPITTVNAPIKQLIGRAISIASLNFIDWNEFFLF